MSLTNPRPYVICGLLIGAMLFPSSASAGLWDGVTVNCPTILWKDDSSGFTCWAHTESVFQFSCERETFALGGKLYNIFDLRRRLALAPLYLSYRWLSLFYAVPHDSPLLIPGVLRRSPALLVGPTLHFLFTPASQRHHRKSPDTYMIEMENGKRFRLSQNRDASWTLEQSPKRDAPWKVIAGQLRQYDLCLAASPDGKKLVVLQRDAYGGGGFLSAPSPPSANIWVVQSDGLIEREFTIKSGLLATSKNAGSRAGYPMVFRKSQVGDGLNDHHALERCRAIRSLIGGDVTSEQLDPALPLLCDESQMVRQAAADLFNRIDRRYAADEKMKAYLASRALVIKKLLEGTDPNLLHETLSVVARNSKALRETWRAVAELRNCNEYADSVSFRRTHAEALTGLRRHVGELNAAPVRSELVSRSKRRLVSFTTGGETPSGTRPDVTLDEGERVRRLQFSATGKFAAGIVPHDKGLIVRVWDAQTGKKKFDVFGNERERLSDDGPVRYSPILKFWISPDETTLVCAPHDRHDNLIVNDIVTGKALWKVQCPNRVFDVAFSSDSRQFVAQTSYWTHYGDVYECFVAETRTGKFLRGRTASFGKPKCIGLLQGGQTLIVGRRVYRTTEKETRIELVESPVGTPVAASNDRLWVWNHEQKSLDGFDLNSGAKLFELAIGVDRPCVCVTALGENRIRCDYQGGAVAVWSTSIYLKERDQHESVCNNQNNNNISKSQSYLAAQEVWKKLWAEHEAGKFSREIVQRYGIAALPVYRERLKSRKSEETVLALKAIIELGENTNIACPEIFELLSHDESEVRKTALGACFLIKSDSDRLVRVLSERLFDADETRNNKIVASSLLGKHKTSNALDALLRALQKEQDSVVVGRIMLDVRFFTDHREKVAPALLPFLHNDDPRVVLHAACSLRYVESNSKMVLATLASRMDVHFADYGHDYEKLYFQTIGGFGAEAQGLTPQLIRVADNDKSSRGKRAALALLKINPESMAVRALFERMILDPERSSNSIMKDYLHAVGPEEALPMLFRALQHSDSNVNRPAAFMFRYAPKKYWEEYKPRLNNLMKQDLEPNHRERVQMAQDTFGNAGN